MASVLSLPPQLLALICGFLSVSQAMIVARTSNSIKQLIIKALKYFRWFSTTENDEVICCRISQALGIEVVFSDLISSMISLIGFRCEMSNKDTKYYLQHNGWKNLRSLHIGQAQNFDFTLAGVIIPHLQKLTLTGVIISQSAVIPWKLSYLKLIGASASFSTPWIDLAEISLQNPSCLKTIVINLSHFELKIPKLGLVPEVHIYSPLSDDTLKEVLENPHITQLEVPTLRDPILISKNWSVLQQFHITELDSGQLEVILHQGKNFPLLVSLRGGFYIEEQYFQPSWCDDFVEMLQERLPNFSSLRDVCLWSRNNQINLRSYSLYSKMLGMLNRDLLIKTKLQTFLDMPIRQLILDSSIKSVEVNLLASTESSYWKTIQQMFEIVFMTLSFASACETLQLNCKILDGLNSLATSKYDINEIRNSGMSLGPQFSVADEQLIREWSEFEERINFLLAIELPKLTSVRMDAKTITTSAYYPERFDQFFENNVENLSHIDIRAPPSINLPNSIQVIKFSCGSWQVTLPERALPQLVHLELDEIDIDFEAILRPMILKLRHSLKILILRNGDLTSKRLLSLCPMLAEFTELAEIVFESRILKPEHRWYHFQPPIKHWLDQNHLVDLRKVIEANHNLTVLSVLIPFAGSLLREMIEDARRYLVDSQKLNEFYGISRQNLSIVSPGTSSQQQQQAIMNVVRYQDRNPEMKPDTTDAESSLLSGFASSNTSEMKISSKEQGGFLQEFHVEVLSSISSLKNLIIENTIFHQNDHLCSLKNLETLTFIDSGGCNAFDAACRSVVNPFLRQIPSLHTVHFICKKLSHPLPTSTLQLIQSITRPLSLNFHNFTTELTPQLQSLLAPVLSKITKLTVNYNKCPKVLSDEFLESLITQVNLQTFDTANLVALRQSVQNGWLRLKVGDFLDCILVESAARFGHVDRLVLEIDERCPLDFLVQRGVGGLRALELEGDCRNICKFVRQVCLPWVAVVVLGDGVKLGEVDDVKKMVLNGFPSVEELTYLGERIVC